MNERHVDRADARVAATTRDAAATNVLEAVGRTPGMRLDVGKIAVRLADIERTVDAGHEVTLLRGGEPWATVTPI